MKKLKLTINGDIKTFDLPENGEYKVEVVNKYVPQVGDCVRVDWEDSTFDFQSSFFKVVGKNKHIYYATSVDIEYGKSKIDLIGGLFYSFNTYTQITPEELKAKYADAGYDWDYESNTVKPIKWKPKDGDEVWYLESLFKPVKYIFDKDDITVKIMLDKGFLFPTKEKCQKFADHCISYINNKKE